MYLTEIVITSGINKVTTFISKAYSINVTLYEKGGN